MVAENLQKASVTNDLRFLWLEITGRCNLSCSHCYAESGSEAELHGSLTYRDWTRIIDEAAELGCRSVSFIGGEPTMHPRLSDLVEHANCHGFEFIEVFTNATRLDKGLVDCFHRCGVHVAASFYSDDPGVHEQITGGKGSWQQTVQGLKNVLTAGLRLRVGVIETVRNAGHASHAIEFLKSLGVRDIRVDRQRHVGRSRPARPADEKEHFEELCGQCWKGKLCVTSSGEAFPCVFSRATRLGDATSGLAGIMKTAKLADFRRRVRAMYEGVPSDENVPWTPSASATQCNPDDCGPGGCNPAAGCNPDGCGPGSCNPAAHLRPEAARNTSVPLPVG